MAKDKSSPETASEEKPKRQHKATYATDKRKGGYMIRVIGPNANKFGPRVSKDPNDKDKEIVTHREIPVVRKDDSETTEKVGKLVWSGTDDDTGKPCALYELVKKPKGADADEIPF